MEPLFVGSSSGSEVADGSVWFAQDDAHNTHKFIVRKAREFVGLREGPPGTTSSPGVECSKEAGESWIQKGNDKSVGPCTWPRCRYQVKRLIWFNSMVNEDAESGCGRPRDTGRAMNDKPRLSQRFEFEKPPGVAFLGRFGVGMISGVATAKD